MMKARHAIPPRPLQRMRTKNPGHSNPAGTLCLSVQAHKHVPEYLSFSPITDSPHASWRRNRIAENREDYGPWNLTWSNDDDGPEHLSAGNRWIEERKPERPAFPTQSITGSRAAVRLGTLSVLQAPGNTCEKRSSLPVQATGIVSQRRANPGLALMIRPTILVLKRTTVVPSRREWYSLVLNCKQPHAAWRPSEPQQPLPRNVTEYFIDNHRLRAGEADWLAHNSRWILPPSPEEDLQN
jgi:hypothetical protein